MKKMFVWLAMVIIAFAVLLPLYYVFSSDKSDGLETTIEQGNATTGEGHTAPLSYGENYVESLAYGVTGIIITFAVFYVLLLVIRRKKGDG